MSEKLRNSKSASACGEASADALSAYLRAVGTMPPLDPEAQRLLGDEIDAKTGRLRELLTKFDFVVRDIMTLVDRCWTCEAAPADIFMPSSLPETNEKCTASTLEALRRWREELAALLESGDREKLTAALARYLINASFLEKYYNAVAQAVTAVRGGSIGEIADGAGLSTAAHGEISALIHSDEASFFQDFSALEATHEELITLRQKMIESNLRLVISIARRYRNRGLPFDDLIQEGNLGLLHALERFDFKLGNRFSTYASWWIHHCVSRATAEQVRIIRLPVHMINTITAMNRAEQRFIHIHGREPQMSELAAMLELPVARVNAIRKMSCQTISLQSPLGDDEDSDTLEAVVADDEAVNPMLKYSHKLLFQKLYEVIGTLPERERNIIIMRFGLYGQPRLPLNEISVRVNLTRERVRQLEKKVLETLRSPSKIKYIEGGLGG